MESILFFWERNRETTPDVPAKTAATTHISIKNLCQVGADGQLVCLFSRFYVESDIGNYEIYDRFRRFNGNYTGIIPHSGRQTLDSCQIPFLKKTKFCTYFFKTARYSPP